MKPNGGTTTTTGVPSGMSKSTTMSIGKGGSKS